MNNFHRQCGASLIEIAITFLILSTSLLAMATLQTRSLQYNKSSAMRSQANIYAYDIIDRIRINRGKNSVNIGSYKADYDATPSGNALATTDMTDWRANINSALPDGKGKVDCAVATQVCTINIKWSEAQIFGSGTKEADAENVLTYSTSI